MTLQALLLAECERSNLLPEFLGTESASSKPLQALLQEAQQLRQKEQAGLALKLLDVPGSVGISNPWIEASRAECFHQLGLYKEARDIWMKQRSVDSDSLRSQAVIRIQQLDLQQSLPDVKSAIQQLASDHDWSLRADLSQLSSVSMFQHALLEEAIRSRECNQFVFSMALMDLALQAGFSSPWLHDNRARALVELERLDEACEAWQIMLSCSSNSDVKRVAEQMLVAYQPRRDAMAKKITTQAQMAFAMERAQAGEREEAIQFLVNALIDNPTSQACESTLKLLLDERRQEQDKDWGLFSAMLHAQELELELSELLLAALTDTIDADVV